MYSPDADEQGNALVYKTLEQPKGLFESATPVLARFRATLLEIEAAELKDFTIGCLRWTSAQNMKSNSSRTVWLLESSNRL